MDKKINSKIKQEIHNLIFEIKEKSIPARILFNGYLRKNNFNSKIRREISDYFYETISFFGALKNNKENFDLDNVKKLFFNSDVTLEILTSVCGFEKEIAKKIFNSFDNPNEIKLFYNRAPMTVRINNMKINRDIYFYNLSNKYSLEKTKFSPFGIKFNNHINVKSLEEYKKGLFEIQDEASQLISIISPIKPNIKILDYCAGTGGKSLSIADRLFGAVNIDAYDISKKRLNILKQRANKLKININLPKFIKNNYYDFVLVDAPCSGLGTLRRDKDLNLRLDLNKLNQIIELQKEVFDKALKTLKNGGFIFYITCSFLNDENEKQVEYFLDKYNNLELIPIKNILDNNLNNLFNTYFKTNPTLDEMDAFFGAIFKKS